MISGTGVGPCQVGPEIVLHGYQRPLKMPAGSQPQGGSVVVQVVGHRMQQLNRTQAAQHNNSSISRRIYSLAADFVGSVRQPLKICSR